MKSFDSKPDHDEAPDTCQYGSCQKPPVKVVRYRDPKEYVCYCKEHAAEQRANREGAKYRSRLDS